MAISRGGTSFRSIPVDLTSISPVAVGLDFGQAGGGIAASTIGGILGSLGTEIVKQLPSIIGTGQVSIPGIGNVNLPSIIPPTYNLNVTATKKRRHMNVCNASALRRAMRRVGGFAKFSKKCISFTHKVKMRKGRKCR